jgi:hypothetical protein
MLKSEEILWAITAQLGAQELEHEEPERLAAYIYNTKHYSDDLALGQDLEELIDEELEKYAGYAETRGEFAFDLHHELDGEIPDWVAVDWESTYDNLSQDYFEERSTTNYGYWFWRSV